MLLVLLQNVIMVWKCIESINLSKSISNQLTNVTCFSKTLNKSQGRCFWFYLYSIVWPIYPMHSAKQNGNNKHIISYKGTQYIDAVHTWVTPFIIVHASWALVIEREFQSFQIVKLWLYRINSLYWWFLLLMRNFLMRLVP